jgi:hypothetical protein
MITAVIDTNILVRGANRAPSEQREQANRRRRVRRRVFLTSLARDIARKQRCGLPITVQPPPQARPSGHQCGLTRTVLDSRRPRLGDPLDPSGNRSQMRISLRVFARWFARWFAPHDEHHGNGTDVIGNLICALICALVCAGCV